MFRHTRPQLHFIRDCSRSWTILSCSWPWQRLDREGNYKNQSFHRGCTKTASATWLHLPTPQTSLACAPAGSKLPPTRETGILTIATGRFDHQQLHLVLKGPKTVSKFTHLSVRSVPVERIQNECPSLQPREREPGFERRRLADQSSRSRAQEQSRKTPASEFIPDLLFH